MSENILSQLGKLKGIRDELYQKIKCICRFPMRLAPPEERFYRFEKVVEKNYSLNECNLFSYSINPIKYLENSGESEAVALYRFFILNEHIKYERLLEILGESLLNTLLGCQLIEVADDNIVSLFRLIPFKKNIYITDPYSQDIEMVYLSYDSLFFVNYLLKNISNNFDSLFDLGCGSGIIGLHLHRYFSAIKEIVGIDVNNRAIRMAKANALINNIPANFILGSWENKITFMKNSLVLFNPPFVLIPDGYNKPIHSDGGEMGVETTLKIITKVAAQLDTIKCFYGLCCSPQIDGKKHPVLIEKLAKFSDVRFEVDVVGKLPVFKKFEAYYKERGISELCQIVIKGYRGNGMVVNDNSWAFDNYCFG